MKLEVGKRVRIRRWDDMASEFELDKDGDFKLTPFCLHFTQYMKHLCGREATIVDCSDREKILLDDWSDDSGSLDWCYTEEMFEEAL